MLLALQLVVGALGAVALFATHTWALSDVTYYFDWTGQIVHRLLPYRDFFFDYPPLALPVLLVPRALTAFADITYGTYLVIFAACMAVLAAILGGTVRTVVRRMGDALPAGGLRRYTLAMLLSLPLLLVRFDLWPILFTGWAYLAALDRRPGFSGALLGIGAAAKLYPALLVPIFAGYWWYVDGRRASASHVFWALVAAFLALLPFILLAPDGLRETLTFQQGRGLQVETAAAGIFQLVAVLGGTPLEITHVTTYELGPDAVGGYLAVQPFLAGIVLVGTVVAAWRRFGRTAPASAPLVLAATSAAILIAFMLTNRALSPQHVFWLVPFAALMAGWRYALLATIFAATLVIFPLAYDGLLAQDLLPVLLLNLRNLLLLVLGAALLIRPARFEARA